MDDAGSREPGTPGLPGSSTWSFFLHAPSVSEGALWPTGWARFVLGTNACSTHDFRHRRRSYPRFFLRLLGGDKVPSRFPADGRTWEGKRKTKGGTGQKILRENRRGYSVKEPCGGCEATCLHRIPPPPSPLAGAVSPECLT